MQKEQKIQNIRDMAEIDKKMKNLKLGIKDDDEIIKMKQQRELSLKKNFSH